MRVELQADCLAGVWAHSTYERNLLEPGDLDEPLAAAAAAGDDFLKRPNLRLVSARDAAALLLVILAVVFILENRGSATIRVLIPVINAPLWTALLACVLLGVVLGWPSPFDGATPGPKPACSCPSSARQRQAHNLATRWSRRRLAYGGEV